MYCSQCGKKVGDTMLFCPFCGAPIVIPEQDDDVKPAPPAKEAPAPVAEPAAAEPVYGPAAPEPAEDLPAPVSEPAVPEPSESIPAPIFEPIGAEPPVMPVPDVPKQDEPEPPVPSGPEAESEGDAAAELLEWSRERANHMDEWARPEGPAEDFSPLTLDLAEDIEEKDERWREEITQKKQAVKREKKPPEMNRGKEAPVRLEGSAPKLELDVEGAKHRAKDEKRRKHANTLVPSKTMDPNDLFMAKKAAAYDEVDPYDEDAPDEDFEDGFVYEDDDDEGSFFMRHLRGIVGLAMFAILLLMFVIYAFSRAGQVTLARVNMAWSKDAYSTLGYQNYQAGQYGEAGLYYERALQRDPNSYSYASSAAMAYLEAGDNDRAAAMLKRCAEIEPTKLEPYIYLLKLYPDAASRPWDITQLLQQGYQRTGDSRLNVSG